MKKSILTKKQVKKFSKKIKMDGKNCLMDVKVRYDDQCNNGHNTFAITADIYQGKTRSERSWFMGGCCHDEIAKYFPELKFLIKWHLFDSDGPMYYIENTTYHARTCSHKGKQVGDPVMFEKFLTFAGIPFTFEEQEKGFWEYLDSVGDFNNIEVEIINYDGKDNYSFDCKYSLTGFIKENQDKKWYKAPFDTKREADEFLQALRKFTYCYVEIPTEWASAVDPDIEAARHCAIWPDATIEQLQDEQALRDRLPGLIEAFIKDIEDFGFVY